jgi:hypothetical protein
MPAGEENKKKRNYQFEQGPAVFLFAGGVGSSICRIQNTIQKEEEEEEKNKKLGQLD